MADLIVEQISPFDIVDFLASIGIHPKKISAHNYWYLSPFPGLATEDPTFRVNRQTNRWQDFTAGGGSSVIDFGIQELKERLSSQIEASGFVPQQKRIKGVTSDQPISIIKTYSIRSNYLINYLWERRISLHVAQLYCIEALFTIGSEPYYAIGFRSDVGGYQLRNKFRQYSTKPEGPTLISHQARDIAVFTDFLDMLTFITFTHTPTENLPDFLVLNSSFFESSLPLLKPYRKKYLFLDNNRAGTNLTDMALALKESYFDHRPLYRGYKSLNQWVCDFGKASVPALPK